MQGIIAYVQAPTFVHSLILQIIALYIYKRPQVICVIFVEKPMATIYTQETNKILTIKELHLSITQFLQTIKTLIMCTSIMYVTM